MRATILPGSGRPGDRLPGSICRFSARHSKAHNCAFFDSNNEPNNAAKNVRNNDSNNCLNNQPYSDGFKLRYSARFRSLFNRWCN